MKKALAIVLLTIFSFHIAGYTMLFYIQKYHLRKEMIRQIQNGAFDAELTTVLIDASNKHLITWHGKDEFQYKKSMYDVVKTKKVNSQTTIYYCITDINEMKLLAKLKQQLSKSNKKSRVNSVKIPIKYLAKKVEKIQNKEVNTPKLKSILSKIFNSYSSLFQEVKSPPPKQQF